MATSTNQK
jgi:hypothetical protein